MCVKYCDENSPLYDPTACRICWFVKSLIPEPPKVKWPPPGPLVVDRYAEEEFAQYTMKLLGELAYLAIKSGEVDASCEVLTIMKDAGVYKEVAESELRRHEARVAAIRAGLEQLAAK